MVNLRAWGVASDSLRLVGHTSGSMLQNAPAGIHSDETATPTQAKRIGGYLGEPVVYPTENKMTYWTILILPRLAADPTPDYSGATPETRASGSPFTRSRAVIERQGAPCVLEPPECGQGNREHGDLSIKMPGVDGAYQLVG
jgi:hypothetical protein